MPVDTPHPEYSNYLDRWDTIDDVWRGTVALRDEKYIPRRGGQVPPNTKRSDESKYPLEEADVEEITQLHTQSFDDYERMLIETACFNAAKETVETNTGLVFQEPPTRSWSDDHPLDTSGFTEDVSQCGQSLDTFAARLLREAMTTGRCGVLVDMPSDEKDFEERFGRRMNLKERADAKVLPRWNYYGPTNIINWQEMHFRGRYQNVQTVLRSLEPVSVVDEFSREMVEQFRVLDFNNEGYYRHRVFRRQVTPTGDAGEDKQSENILYQGEVVPERNGEPINKLPFFPFSHDNCGMAIQDPMSESLFEKTLQLFQQETNFYHVLSYMVPQWWGKGMASSEIPQIMGAGVFLPLRSEQGHIGVAQANDGGLTSQLRAIEQLRDQLLALGARTLSSATGRETATQVNLHNQKALSQVAKAAKAVSEQLTSMLQFTSWWMGHDDWREIDYSLNTRSLPNPWDADTIRVMMDVVLSGLMSPRTFLEGMHRNRVSNTTADDELNRLGSEPIPDKEDSAEDNEEEEDNVNLEDNNEAVQDRASSGVSQDKIAADG